MRKLLILLSFSLLIVLSACSNTKTITCTAVDFEWVIEFNEEEIISATDNGNDVSDEEIDEMNEYITTLIDDGHVQSMEDFLVNDYATTLERDGVVCNLD